MVAIAAARWVDTACGGLRMLVQPPGALLLRETGASCSPLLSQRLSAALLPRLAPSSAGDRPAGAPGSAAASLWRVHATVMVLLGLPAAALPPLLRLAPTASLWLRHVLQHCCDGGDGGGDSVPRALLGGDAAAERVEQALAVMLAFAGKLPEANNRDGAQAEAALAEAIPAALRFAGLATQLLPPGPASRLTERALQLLDSAASTLPPPTLYPLKKRVLRDLQDLLDHRKRVVRSAASRCSNRWHAVKG